MINTIRIGGTVERFMFPPATTETLDESLDTGSFIIPFSTRDKPFDIFDTVVIEKDGGFVDSFVIAGDQVRLTSKSPSVYEHKVSLVEYTKKLERYTISTAIFTQPGGIYKGFYSSGTVLRDTYPETILDPSVRKDWYAVVDGVSGTYRWNIAQNGWFLDITKRAPYMISDVLIRLVALRHFVLVIDEISSVQIDSNLIDQVKGIKAPEFQFNNKTLRACLDEVLRYVGAIARLKPAVGYDVVHADYFNNLKDLIDTSKQTDYIQTQDINGYATGLTTDAVNAISNNEYGASNVAYPAFEGYATLSDGQADGIIQDDDLRMPTGLPIYKLNEGRAYLEISSIDPSTAPTNTRVTMIVELEIGDYIYEKSKWDTLAHGDRFITEEGIATKGNAIYYTKGDKVIDGLSNVIEYPLTLGQDFSRWHNLIVTAANIYLAEFYTYPYVDIADLDVVLETAEADVLYNLDFVTQNDVKNIKIERTLLDDIDKKSNFFINQSDRGINIDNFGRNSQGKLDQTGPEVRKLTLKHDKWVDIFEIGDYTTDGYIITQREIIYEQEFYMVSYMMTKNFNRISEFIGIDREYRAFDILDIGNNAKRIMTYVDYVKLGFNSPTSNTSMLTELGIFKFADTFKTNKSLPEKMQNAKFNIVDSWGSGNDPFIAPLNSFSFGNTLVFAWEFDSPQFAGFKRVPEANLDTTVAINYTDGEALLNNFSVEFIGGLEYGPSFFTARTVAYALPEYTGTSISFVSSGLFNARKDPSEMLGMNYILQLYKEFADKDKIVIGKSLTNINDIIGNDNDKLYFWTSADTYQESETNKAKGTRISELPGNVGMNIYYSGNPAKAIGFGVKTISTPSAGVNSWAVADADGNLLFALNRVSGVLEEELYFSFEKNRTGLNKL